MKILRLHLSKDPEEMIVPWEDVDQTWLGIAAVKNPTDAWLYQEIIYKIRPDFIIETGSSNGGGALFLATMLDICGIDGVVYSIDIAQEPNRPCHPKISWITGSSVDPEIVGAIMQKVGGGGDLLFLTVSTMRPMFLRRCGLIGRWWPKTLI